MTEERLHEIFEDEDIKPECDNVYQDNAYQGLQIIEKYAKETIIFAAEHDMIYSIGIKNAIENGLTEEDAIKLRKLNWSIDSDNNCFCCFV